MRSCETYYVPKELLTLPLVLPLGIGWPGRDAIQSQYHERSRVFESSEATPWVLP